MANTVMHKDRLREPLFSQGGNNLDQSKNNVEVMIYSALF